MENSRKIDNLLKNLSSKIDTLKCAVDDISCDCGDGGGDFFFSVTRSEAETLVDDSLLVPGAMYRISDRGDRGIYLTAISTTQFEREGVRRMLCPADYATETDGSGNVWLGIWSAALTPSIGDLTIWGGSVFVNLFGANSTSAGDYALDSDQWDLVPKDSFTNNEYIEMIFGVSYDFDNDWIERQWDGKGNVFGCSWGDAVDQYDVNHNFVDISDWNFGSISLYDVRFKNNDCLGVYNNVISGRITDNILPRAYGGAIFENIGNEIANNQNFGTINLNTSSYIYNNRNDGRIENNSCKVFDNSNEGDINDNTSGDIGRNRNIGTIANNSHNGTIYQNINNGYIINCVGSSGFNVQFNTNNGNIDNPDLTLSDVTDTIVNK